METRDYRPRKAKSIEETSSIRSSSSLTTNISAEIVDIRPNGVLVLNATKTIKDNDNTFVFSLTGSCRSQDILPDNTILSRNILNPLINKQESGHVRDGYSTRLV